VPAAITASFIAQRPVPVPAERPDLPNAYANSGNRISLVSIAWRWPAQPDDASRWHLRGNFRVIQKITT
jgi:hypothetical protein